MENIYMEVKCCLTSLQKTIGLKIKVFLKIEKHCQIKKIDINKQRLYLEEDLDYQKAINKLHKDFPLAPGHYNVTYNGLSPISQVLYNKMKNGN